MSILAKVRRRNWAVLFRFALSSLGTMAIKVGLTWLLARGVDEYLSYALTHTAIFFWSYYSHLRFTFNETHTRTRLGAYFRAVVLIKVLDFLLFSVFLKLSSNQLSLSVLIASALVTFARFFSIRQALTKGRRDATDPDITQ